MLQQCVCVRVYVRVRNFELIFREELPLEEHEGCPKFDARTGGSSILLPLPQYSVRKLGVPRSF